MCEYLNSPLLGRVRIPTKEEKAEIIKYSKECSLATFQALNNYFNSLGLCLSIVKTPKEHSVTGYWKTLIK